ncbi:MAG: FtsH protease activity modulator HflK [Aquimonas sp.]|nr:FtsH protease activity modulator HflK [Aquimonas sp.]
MSDARKTVENLFGGGRGSRAGGGGGGTPQMPQLPKPPLGMIAAGAAVVIALWGVSSVFYTVQPEERAVVKRFGEVVKIADPGLHFKLPFGVDAVQLVATERVLKQEFGFRSLDSRGGEATQYSSQDFPEESLMLSGDLNIIDVSWVVQYRISDPMKFIYSMREPTRTLRDISESVMRRAVGNRLGSEVLTTGREQIGVLVRKEVQEALDQYQTGIHVMTVELQDVLPPRAVQPAFNEVNEARQERERMINEAQKQANQQLPLARGQANRAIAEAEGYATERVNQALGETARFSSILTEYRVAPEVTRTRMYLETLNEMLPNVGSVVVQQKGAMPPVPLINLRDAQPAAAGDRR